MTADCDSTRSPVGEQVQDHILQLAQKATDLTNNVLPNKILKVSLTVSTSRTNDAGYAALRPSRVHIRARCIPPLGSVRSLQLTKMLEDAEVLRQAFDPRPSLDVGDPKREASSGSASPTVKKRRLEEESGTDASTSQYVLPCNPELLTLLKNLKAEQQELVDNFGQIRLWIQVRMRARVSVLVHA